MHEQTDSRGVVSEIELAELTELFRIFEGVQSPFAQAPLVAKQQFHDKVMLLYATKVKPTMQSVSFSDFLTFTRRKCRQRLAADDHYLCP